MFLRSAFIPLLSLCLLSPALRAQDESGYSPRERINRIRELGKSNSDVIPSLAGYLDDQNRDIRIEAVKAIVKIGTERSLTPLIKASGDNDPEVQVRAVDGMVNFYQPGYVVRGGLTGPFVKGVRQVKSFFSNRDDEVIDPGITVRQDVSEAIGRVVQSGSSTDARADAALGAGILRARPALPNLIEALRSKDSALIFESLVAMQKIGDRSAGPRATFLLNDFDERVQTTALETVGVLRAQDAEPDVRRALTNAKNIRIRRAALESLAMLAQPGDRATFQDYLADRDDDLRGSALEGLGRIREPEDYPRIEEAYNEKGAGPRVHLAAAFALVAQGKMDTSEFSPLRYLVDTLDSKSSGSDAEAYLTELCAQEAVRKALFPLVPEATKQEKLSLCRSLAQSGASDVLPTLQQLSNDIDPNVSLAATRSLKLVQVQKTQTPGY